MNPFSKLFKKAPPPPPPPTLSERIASLQAAAPETLTATALGSEDPSLRVAAIRLLPDGDALRSLAGLTAATQAAATGNSAEVRQAAHERLAQLIDAGTIDFPAFCNALAQYPETMTITSLCKDAGRLQQMLTRIEDPAVIAKLAVDGPTSRVRQGAAALIDDPAQLQVLLPLVRGKDKSVYKIIKQKCDAFTVARRTAEEAAREALSICESLERHGTRHYDALYGANLEILTARWRELAVRPDAEVEQRGQNAIERCADIVAAHKRELEQKVAAQAAAEAAAIEAREARERARVADQEASAERAESVAQASAEAAVARDEEQRAQAEQQSAETQAHYEIGSLIRLATGALRGGNTRKAARLRLAIDEAMQSAPTVPLYLTRTLHQLDESLNELKQWKDYVAAPKRIELIEEMEALVGVEEDPPALAEHIRALQQEWRTINKGIASDASGDFERFQAAHQAAFKPCQEYFAAQAAIRRENLEARKRVLERLKAFTDNQAGASPDHGLVQQVLREAPQEWRSHSPIDGAANRPFEIEFHRAMDALRNVLNAWFEGNASDKKALITQARHLSTVEDSSQAIDGVKRLQGLWKETGPVSREQSQAMWDEFRGACDAVFQRREQAYAQYSAGLNEVKTQAIALCEQVEQGLSAAATERSNAKEKIAEWNAAFDALGEMPRADARGLGDRFERAITQYEAALAQQDLRDTEAAESNLVRAANHVRAYERAVLAGMPAAEREAVKAAAESFIAGVLRWPKGGSQALKQGLARADAVSAADANARERALRMLCIRAEIVSSGATPPEDESLRADYQMRLLMESMGQASRADERDWDAMLLEWIGIAAIEADVHDALQQRFLRSFEKRPATSAPVYKFRDTERDDSLRQRDSRDRGSRDRDPRDRNGRRDERGRPETQGRR